MALREVAWIRQAAETGMARRLRIEAHCSLREMATEIGASPGALSLWERGLRTPRAEAAARWATALREVAGL